MQKILFILFLLYQLFQAAAITLGLEFWFGMEMMIAMPLAVIIALVPLLGTVTAIFAAMLVWNMHWMVATSVFVLPGVFILTLAMLGEAAESRQAHHNNTRHHHTKQPGRKEPVKKKLHQDDF